MKIISELDENFICEINAPCFQSLNKKEKKIIHKNKTQILFKKGDTLSKQSAFSSSVLYIIDGVIKTYIETPDGKNYNFSLRTSGDFIGLSSAFSQDTYSYSSSALTDSHAFVIEKNAISEIMKLNGSFSHHLLSSFCKQNNNIYSIISQLLYKQMNGRLADSLLYVNSFKESIPHIFQLMTRKDIAEFTGITVESTVKLLKSYEKDGLIKLHEKDIIISNIKMLEEISKRG